MSLGSKEGSWDNKHSIHECKQLIDNSKITKLLPYIFKSLQEKIKIFWELVINKQKINITFDKSR